MYFYQGYVIKLVLRHTFEVEFRVREIQKGLKDLAQFFYWQAFLKVFDGKEEKIFCEYHASLW